MTKNSLFKNSDRKVLLGKITAPFGIKGELKILSYCQDPFAIVNYPLLDENDDPIELTISSKTAKKTSTHDTIITAYAKGVEDRNAAELMRNVEIYTLRKHFGANDENEFYHDDLIGLDVIDVATKNKIGEIINIYNDKAGAFLEIEFDKADKEKNLDKIESFAFKKEIFLEVNLEKNFVIIDVPEIIIASAKINKDSKK